LWLLRPTPRIADRFLRGARLPLVVDGACGGLSPGAYRSRFGPTRGAVPPTRVGPPRCVGSRRAVWSSVVLALCGVLPCDLVRLLQSQDAKGGCPCARRLVRYRLRCLGAPCAIRLDRPRRCPHGRPGRSRKRRVLRPQGKSPQAGAWRVCRREVHEPRQVDGRMGNAAASDAGPRLVYRPPRCSRRDPRRHIRKRVRSRPRHCRAPRRPLDSVRWAPHGPKC
jgi:hypothetical protein